MKVMIDIPEDIYNEIKEKHEISAEKFIRHTAYLEVAVEYGIPFPEDATNGEMIKTLFPNDSRNFLIVNMERDWWKEPYIREEE